MNAEQRKPVRERVVLAERRGARVVRARVEVAEQTEVGAVLIGGLIRAQFGLAVRLGSVTVVVLGALPLLFLGPLGTATVFGIRLPWLLLGAAAYPLLFVVGRIYTRLAERNERDFNELTRD
ncbi:hypothetical protein GPX89_33250 [Nocardia sp. ET3-3]|uniref:DUF485 domain-containing protein n=1 Tax=Nocardia terrae TaxID=2675851 RepID=A0A7K1V612_9NOCA|nr:hypothetical protein [Nocardia terrae]MVU82093.1 hypothetical protein [Nocardia terrae]